jgi:hypothetical protein
MCERGTKTPGLLNTWSFIYLYIYVLLKLVDFYPNNHLISVPNLFLTV